MSDVQAAVREKPILFSSEMVRAILDRRKSMTRRVVKPQPTVTESGGPRWRAERGKKHIPNGPRSCAGGSAVTMTDLIGEYCPYGQPGDRLWVRETWRPILSGTKQGGFDYRADDPGASGDGFIAWKPSIHMPRRASRITLEITEVRVERVQDISEDDAKKEGINPVFPSGSDEPTYINGPGGFKWLWDSIKGKGSWESNPWVWVISFNRLEAQ